MIFSEAKREFEIRCYYWWISEFEKEVNASFPNLRLFKSGFGWKMHHFMRELDRSDQLTLARAILKRWHSADLKELGEGITEKEKGLLESFDRFASEPSSLEVEIQARKRAGEKIELASKRKLRKAAVSKFLEAFGSQCFDVKLGEEWDLLFHMKCCGWILSTQLTFGRRQPVLSYRHMIVSETWIAHPQNPQIIGPAMALSLGVAWLENQWEDIVEDDLDSVCNALVTHAG
ncbi:MAG: hypothetical protein AB1813_21705 [Verrucomicrobiota bacterium]